MPDLTGLDHVPELAALPLPLRVPSHASSEMLVKLGCFDVSVFLVNLPKVQGSIGLWNEEMG